MFGKAEYTLAYIVAILMGALTIVYPSEPVQGIIGYGFTAFYGLLILGGGIFALYGLRKPNYRTEMYALFTLATGTLCYAAALGGIFFQRVFDPSDDLNPAYGPPLIVLAFAILIIVKAHYLFVKQGELIKVVQAVKSSEQR